MSYDNSKQVIIRKVVSDKPNAPALSVQFKDSNGVDMEAAMWQWTRKDGTPVLDKNGNAMYQGTYKEDTYTTQQNANGMEQARSAAEPAPAAPAADPFEDDIPF